MTEEKIITESSNGLIRLTNHKIRYTSKSFGKARIVSIMLSEISGIEVHFKSYPPAFLIGVLFVLAGTIISTNSSDFAPAFVFTFVGFLFFLYYATSRRHVISVISRGKCTINFECKGLSSEAIFQFINKVEKAKKEYEATL